jgi:hypothetical protein
MAFLDSIRPAIERYRKNHRSSHNDNKDHVLSDTLTVSYSADILDISEFRFFQLAYFDWFGHTIEDRDMENIFASYLFDSVVPYWARHLARKVLDLNTKGILDPGEFNIKRREITQEMRDKGQWYIIVVFMIMVLFCFLVANYVPPS